MNWLTHHDPQPSAAAVLPVSQTWRHRRPWCAIPRSVGSQRHVNDPFIGPTSVCAFMQNKGVVNDHIHGCFRAEDYIQPHTTWEREAR